MSEGHKLFGFGHERRLDSESAHTVDVRKQVVDGAVYWVVHSMQRTKPDLETEVMKELYPPAEHYPQTEDRQLLANAALNASLGTDPMPETSVEGDSLDLHAPDVTLNPALFMNNGGYDNQPQTEAGNVPA